MTDSILLRGITWNHSRALPPLVAATQRFEEMHPGVVIRWEKRSLHEFGHSGLESMVQEYDLLVIDHPMLGTVAELDLFHPLEELVAPELIQDLQVNSVGRSFTSYSYAGHLWALPIDAAAPSASYRPDLLQRAGVAPPIQWQEVLDLARRGLVVMPGFYADVFLNLMGIYVSCGGIFDGSGDCLLQGDLATECLERLGELAAYLPGEIYDWNPIAVYEHLASDDTHAYCPFAYSYSNYARRGFGRNLLLFTNPVSLDAQQPLCTILGGTGLAISKHCHNTKEAASFAAFAAGAECQSTLYTWAGGQPAHRQAWLDPAINSLTHGFFTGTLDCMDRAFVRPRYPGYTNFQGKAGLPIVDWMQHGGKIAAVINKVNCLYRESRALP